MPGYGLNYLNLCWSDGSWVAHENLDVSGLSPHNSESTPCDRRSSNNGNTRHKPDLTWISKLKVGPQNMLPDT